MADDIGLVEDGVIRPWGVPTAEHIAAWRALKERAVEGLTEGRIVHYVLPDGRNPGEHRPAIVVKVWPSSNGSANLMVFVDGTNDYADYSGAVWATSVPFSEEPQPRTWHWIERA